MKKQTITLIIILLVLLSMGYFTCPIYKFAGIPCPACGMTRGWRAVLSLDFATAFSMHPLFPIPLLIFVPKLRKKWVFFTVLGLFLAVYIVRMALLFPHTEPMNYNYNSLLGGLFK